MQFEGIWTPIVTPVHDDFSVNETALTETVEHSPHTEVGGTRTPYRSQTRGRQHGDHCFRQIRKEAGNPITSADPTLFQSLRQSTDHRPKVIPRDLPHLTALAEKEDGGFLPFPTKEVSREVQPCLGKPRSPQHPFSHGGLRRSLLHLDLRELQ